jgi:hypothetical protein
MNMKVHYRVHESPSQHSDLSQMNPVHNLTTCFFKIYFNIILPSMSRGVYPKVSGLSWQRNKNKHSLRSNTEGYGAKIHSTDS